MKTLKHLFSLLAFCMLALNFTACEKDGPEEGAIWDFHPIQIYFTLTGDNGEDLLDPSTPGSYAGLKITATYEDKIYEKDAFEGKNIPYGRAIFAHLYGIYTIQLTDGRYALCFGELNGDDTYKDATITLNWGDGTTDVLTFSSKLKWKGHDPVINRSFKLNGTEMAKDTPCPIIEVKKSALHGELENRWNISPLKFSIFLSNKNNKDLLNTVGLYNITAIFQGKEYSLNNYPEEDKIDQPVFNGLTRYYWHDQNSTTPYPIYFGELDGTETFENEMLIMDWGTLGCDTITFTSKIEWENDKPTFIRHYSLNGKEVDKGTSSPIIRIVKDIE